jgi:hypothetical protein
MNRGLLIGESEMANSMLESLMDDVDLSHRSLPLSEQRVWVNGVAVRLETGKGPLASVSPDP